MSINLESLVEKRSDQKLMSFNKEYCRQLLTNSTFLDKCYDLNLQGIELSFHSMKACNYVELFCEFVKLGISENIDVSSLSNAEILRIVEISERPDLISLVIGSCCITTEACGGYREIINQTPADILAKYIDQCAVTVCAAFSTVEFREYNVEKPDKIKLEECEANELDKAVKSIIKIVVPNCENMSSELAVAVLKYSKILTPLVQKEIASNNEILSMFGLENKNILNPKDM